MRAELEQTHSDVIFAGFRTGEDLAAHYASADMFVFASQTETFGNVTLEAMASGLAVVAFKHAAAGELIHSGINGMLAAHDSGVHFEMAAQALLNNPELMTYVRQQACVTAKAMGWDMIVQKQNRSCTTYCGNANNTTPGLRPWLCLSAWFERKIYARQIFHRQTLVATRA